MPVELRCECGTTVQVPDRFAGERVKCPVCKKSLGTVRVEQKPWWEDHQESLKRIMNPPPSDPASVESELHGRGEQEDELEGLEATVSGKELEGVSGTEEVDHEEILGSGRKEAWPIGAKISVAGLLTLVVALVVWFLVLSPVGPRIERLLGKGGTEEPVSVVSESSSVKTREVPPGEFGPVEGEERSTVPHGTVPVEEETVRPVWRTSRREESEVHPPSLPSSPEGEESKPTEEMPAGENEGSGSPKALTATKPLYTVTVSSFREKTRADRYVAKLKEDGLEAFEWEVELPDKGRWHRVSVGGFPSLQEAQLFAADLKERGFETFVVKLTSTRKELERPESSP